MPKTKTEKPTLADLKDKSGESLVSFGGTYSVKLVGKRGSGKSTFYLRELKRKAEDIAKKEHDKEIDWSSEEDQAWVKENIAPKIMMRIIDFDITGVEQLMDRESILPRALVGCIAKWSITGIPEELTAFEEAEMALEHYLNQMLDHSEKYPEHRSCRFMVLESEEMLYLKVRDFYSKVAYAAEGVSDMADLMMKRRAEATRSGKFAVLWKQGPREEFGMGIYPLMNRYLTSMLQFSGDIGYNVYITAHVKSITLDWGKDTQRQTVVIDGKPELSDPYFDCILHFEKAFQKGSDMLKVTSEYYISTATPLGKNRMCEDVTMNNTGPTDFWKKVKELKK